MLQNKNQRCPRICGPPPEELREGVNFSGASRPDSLPPEQDPVSAPVYAYPSLDPLPLFLWRTFESRPIELTRVRQIAQ